MGMRVIHSCVVCRVPFSALCGVFPPLKWRDKSLHLSEGMVTPRSGTYPDFHGLVIYMYFELKPNPSQAPVLHFKRDCLQLSWQYTTFIFKKPVLLIIHLKMDDYELKFTSPFYFTVTLKVL